MSPRVRLALSAALAATVATPSVAPAATLFRSTFATPDVPDGGSLALPAGSVVDGFTVVDYGPQANPGVAVALFDRAFPEPGVTLNPYGGSQTLFLGERDRFAGIRRSASTVAGQRLRLTAVLGDPEGGTFTGAAGFNLLVNGVILDTIGFTGAVAGGIDWRVFAYELTATSPTSLIELQSNGTTNGNPVGLLALSAVPEPGTWAMLVAGFATTGIGLRSARGRARHRADRAFNPA